MVPGTTYNVTVGKGGAGATSTDRDGENGADSVFDTLVALGGGGGVSAHREPRDQAGETGASGGGGSQGNYLAPCTLISPGSGTPGQGA